MAKRISAKGSNDKGPPKRRIRKRRAGQRLAIRAFSLDVSDEQKPRLHETLDALESVRTLLRPRSWAGWGPPVREQPFAAIYDIVTALRNAIRDRNTALVLGIYKLALEDLDRVVTAPQFVALLRSMLKSFYRMRAELEQWSDYDVIYAIGYTVRDHGLIAFPQIDEMGRRAVEDVIGSGSPSTKSLVLNGKVDDVIERILTGIGVASAVRYNLLYGKEAARKSRKARKRKAKPRGGT